MKYSYYELTEDISAYFIKKEVGSCHTNSDPSTLLFDKIMLQEGKVYRSLEGRCTLQFEKGNHSYFIKKHFGIGWREIFKNLLQLRLPILSAKNEWQALKNLQLLQIPVPEIVGYGHRGLNPAYMQSFIITKGLPDHISLEELCENWTLHRPGFLLKNKIIMEVARLTRTFHLRGINHRDLYICHFLLDTNAFRHSKIKLYIIDWHRAEVRKKTPKRWLIKDLAALYFSSMDRMSKKDWYRFLREYHEDMPLRDILTKKLNFWLKVKKRGEKLYKKHRAQHNI